MMRIAEIGEVASALAEDSFTLALLHEHELSAPILAELKNLDFPDSLGLLPVGEETQAAFRMMRMAVSSLPALAGAAFLDDLAADFAALYTTGAFGVSPCESFWLSDDHLVCQEAMFELRALYAAAGLVVPDWRKRPDDHLVFQLQFLGRRLAAAANDDDWRRLAGFLDRHLLRWLPDFAARAAARCDTPFYAALAVLTDAWCRQLRLLIAQHLGENGPDPENIEETGGQRQGGAARDLCWNMQGLGGQEARSGEMP